CVQNGVEFSFTTADNDGLGNPGPIAIPAYIGYYIDNLIVDTVTDPSFLQGQGVYFELGTGSATNPVRHVRIGSLSVFNAVRGLHFESAVAGWFTEDVAIGTLIADGCSVEGWGMIRVRHWAAGEVVVCVNITSNSTAWSIGSLTIEDDRASTADYATQGLRLNTVSDGVIAAAVINAGTAAAFDITAVTGEAIIAAMVLRGVATPAA